MAWTWNEWAPHFADLEGRALAADNVAGWLSDWSRVSERISETEQRLYVATVVNTADATAAANLDAFLDGVYQEANRANQGLKSKLLESGLCPEGFEVPLRNMRSEAAMFRDENVSLLADELKLGTKYDQILGSQTVEWNGEELPVNRLAPFLEDADRSVREKAWRATMDRKIEDREALNALWVEFFTLRAQIATNADCASFREFKWAELLRFDYTPDDCKTFHAAIEAVVVPAVTRLQERRRKVLGLDVLRPWDLDVDPAGSTQLRPFSTERELTDGCAAILSQVDPELGGEFASMDREGLLDLDSRKNKAPGGFCTNFDVARKPYVFMNATGTHDDVQTLLHEAGHAFHVFATAHLPYTQQLAYTSEIAEVASMAMELLAGPYLGDGDAGFYTEEEAARAFIQHLESRLTFLPYMAVVDAFQHWAYENPAEGIQAEACEAKWSELSARFMPGVDWSGLEHELAMGWQRKLHIFQVPLYYVEYAIASLGSLQVWKNSLSDQAGAVAKYREMLALGGTRTLPELFAAAGARFAFDTATINETVALIEGKLAELAQVAAP